MDEAVVAQSPVDVNVMAQLCRITPARTASLEMMMTKQELHKLRRLEAETKRLREQLERHMDVYREQLYELVELRTQMDLVRAAVGTD
jgi:hypothetical protein